MIFLLFLILGLTLGSFANVLIYRLPRGEPVGFTRSRCVSCHHQLAWFDLLPLLSFALLKGHCRYCRKIINWRYPLVEAISGALFVLAWWQWGEGGFDLLFFRLSLLEIFLVLFFTDLTRFVLPDKALGAGLAAALFFGAGERWGRFKLGLDIFSLENLLGAVLFFGALYLLWFFSRGTWLGLGDAKLMGLLGLIFGPAGSFVIFYTAIIFGAIIGLILYLCGLATRKTKLPLGTLISAVAGWYLFQGSWLLERFRIYLWFR